MPTKAKIQGAKDPGCGGFLGKVFLECCLLNPPSRSRARRFSKPPKASLEHSGRSLPTLPQGRETGHGQGLERLAKCSHAFALSLSLSLSLSMRPSVEMKFGPGPVPSFFSHRPWIFTSSVALLPSGAAVCTAACKRNAASEFQVSRCLRFSSHRYSRHYTEL